MGSTDKPFDLEALVKRLVPYTMETKHRITMSSTDKPFDLEALAKRLVPYTMETKHRITMSSTDKPFDLEALAKRLVPYTMETKPQNPGDEPPLNLENWLRKDIHQDDSTLTMVTSWRHKLSLASLVSLAVIVVAVALVYMVPKSPSVDLFCCNRLCCDHILDPVRHIEFFPLPLPVNRSAHKVILNELHYPEDILSSLVNQHTRICSSLISTSEELIRSLAYAATMYACSDSNHTGTSFRDGINIARKQLQSTATEVETLAHSYYKIRQDYHGLLHSAVEAAQLSVYQGLLVYSQLSHSWISWMVGIDAYSAYVLPLNEKRRQKEEIRQGVVVLEREVKRLERILRVVQELEYRLMKLAILVNYFWDAEFKVDYVRRQKQLQEWLRQPDFHQPLKHHWNELLASVDEGEKKLAIKVTSEWCERKDTSQR